MDKRRLKYKVQRHNARVPRVQFDRIKGELAIYAVRIVIAAGAVASFFVFPIGYAAIATLIAWIFLRLTMSSSERTRDVDF